MPSRKPQRDGLSRSRSPSPTDSFDSALSSSSTLCSENSNPSSPSSPLATTIPTPPSMYSGIGTRPRRLTPPQKLLGVIDEDSSRVQPDVPLSADRNTNPVARLHVYTAIVNSRQKPTLARSCSPPSNVFDMVTGPNGERFTDLRLNRKRAETKGWKKLMCFG